MHAITTRELLGRGGVELNPAFGRRPSPAKQSLINLGFFAAEFTIAYVAEHNKHAWVRWTGPSSSSATPFSSTRNSPRAMQ